MKISIELNEERAWIYGDGSVEFSDNDGRANSRELQELTATITDAIFPAKQNSVYGDSMQDHAEFLQTFLDSYSEGP